MPSVGAMIDYVDDDNCDELDNYDELWWIIMNYDELRWIMMNRAIIIINNY